MKVKFWGVRGSIASLDQQQYGTGATLRVLKSPRMQERPSS